MISTLLCSSVGLAGVDLVNEIIGSIHYLYQPAAALTLNWIFLFTCISPIAMMNELFSFLFKKVVLQIYISQIENDNFMYTYCKLISWINFDSFYSDEQKSSV